MPSEHHPGIVGITSNHLQFIFVQFPTWTFAKYQFLAIKQGITQCRKHRRAVLSSSGNIFSMSTGKMVRLRQNPCGSSNERSDRLCGLVLQTYVYNIYIHTSALHNIHIYNMMNILCPYVYIYIYTYYIYIIIYIYIYQNEKSGRPLSSSLLPSNPKVKAHFEASRHITEFLHSSYWPYSIAFSSDPYHVMT